MILVEYLPADYRDSPEIEVIQGALDPEVEALWKKKDGIFDQLDLRKATWGLSAWETAWGIPVDPSKDVALRRARIRSKMLGQGPTTVAKVRQVAAAYTDLDTRVDEHPEERYFELAFIGSEYEPKNLDGLSAALDEILPADVGYDYIFVAEAGSLTLYAGFAVQVGRRLTFTVEGRG